MVACVLQLGWLLVSAGLCANPPLRQFDLPRETADKSLKRFSEQSGLEVIFSSQVAKGVVTRAVKGEMTAGLALETMLAGTGLVVVRESKSGAFTVLKAADVKKNTPRAAQKMPGDRPESPDNPDALEEPQKAAKTMNRKNSLAVLFAWLGLAAASAPPVPAADSATAGTAGQSSHRGAISAEESAAATIAGRVSNAATKVNLEGVVVSLEGTGFATRTERDGAYSLRVPAGSYRLIAEYTGMDASAIQVSVAAGATVRRDIALTSALYELEKFTVLGEREGSSLSITQQRNATNVKNVVSADAFGAVADANIGNVLKFLPGISFVNGESEISSILVRGIGADMNSVAVDGTRLASGTVAGAASRATDVSRLAADSIESIEVIKGLTPDLDADSIGGAINLKSKTPFDRSQRLLSFSAGTSYGLIGETYSPLGSVMYSDILGKERKLGVLLTASYNRTQIPSDQARVFYEQTLDTNRPIWFNLNFIGEDALTRARLGFGLRLDYRITDTHRVFVAPGYSYYNNTLFRRRLTTSGITAAQVRPGWTDAVTDTFNHTAGLEQNYRDSRNDTIMFQAGGEGRLPGKRYDYSFNYSKSSSRDHRDLLTRSIAGVGFRFDRSRSNTFPDAIQTSGPDIMNPANSPIGNLDFQDDTVAEKIWGFQVNYQRAFELAVPTSLKAGLRFRSQERVADINRDRYTYIGPDRASGRFIDRSYSHRPLGRYPVYPFVDIPLLKDELRKAPDQFRNVPQNSLLNDFEAEEQVSAGYLMGQQVLGRLSLLAGVRVEETRVRGVGALQQLTPEEIARRQAYVGTVTPEESRRRFAAEFGRKLAKTDAYRDVFPSVHFKYQASKGLSARASWSTSIGRPNFSQIVSTTSVNDQLQTVSTSAVKLKPQHADSFDASMQYYFEPAGMISLGVFLKEIKDFIYRSSGTLVAAGENNGFDGLYQGYQLTTNLNGGSARVRGVEIAYQQQLSRIASVLRGFALFGNYTWLESRGNYGNVDGPVLQVAPIGGFVPRTANVGVSYIRNGWTVRAKMNYIGPGKMQAWNANPLTRQYLYTYKQFDFDLAYDVNSHWGIYINLINAFDAPTFNYYEYVPSRPRAVLNYGGTIKAGVNGRF